MKSSWWILGTIWSGFDVFFDDYLVPFSLARFFQRHQQPDHRLKSIVCMGCLSWDQSIISSCHHSISYQSTTTTARAQSSHWWQILISAVSFLVNLRRTNHNILTHNKNTVVNCKDLINDTFFNQVHTPFLVFCEWGVIFFSASTLEWCTAGKQFFCKYSTNLRRW